MTYFPRSFAITFAISIAARAASVPRLIFVLKTAFARLRFVLQTEHRVDHRNAVFERDLLQRVGDGAGRDVRACSVLPCRMTPSAMIASAFSCSAISRTTIGISKAPGT